MATSSTAAAESHPCPACDRPFPTRRRMRIHHVRAHGESLRPERECGRAGCPETFRVRLGGPETYCSRECAAAARAGAERRTCDRCDEAFEPRRPSSDQRYCSRECADAAKRERERRTCDHCDETFDAPPASDQRFCDFACATAARGGRERRTCTRCDEAFDARPSADRRYCSWRCYDEDRRNRPADRTEYARELYVDEDRSISETARRLPGVGFDATRSLLVEMGWFDPDDEMPLHRRLEQGGPDTVGSDPEAAHDVLRKHSLRPGSGGESA